MDFDVIVIGAGHGGCEAALAPARMGLRTAVLTLRRDRIAFMPCNPAIGGLGKGHLVRELDALGGEMGRAIDAAGIQFRLLNRRKGPAVWSPRAQADKDLYARTMRGALEAQPGLTILETECAALHVETDGGKPRVRAITTADGEEITARAVIITTGTFLAAEMHRGCERTAGGRAGEPPARLLSESFRKLGFRLGRLKTGTPPRLLRDSIDFTCFEPQYGDDPPRPFSHATERLVVDQVPCHIAYTGEDAHALIRANLERAPLYNGQISGTGPRYCPSIEDKVVRFAERARHQLFLEPEGRTSPEIYVNGLSTSLPEDIQREVVHRVPGLERAEILRYGYAVEYDYVPSDQLQDTMETARVAGLYLAGQVNGTSGYEEAAVQGFLAGVNAAAAIRGLPPLVLRRSEAYIGVLADDLVRMTLTEPYRMFTSRAEFRLTLRIDNADERLMPYAEQYGLLRADVRALRERNAGELEVLQQVLERRAEPAQTARIAAATGAEPGAGPHTFARLLRTPGIAFEDLVAECPEIAATRADVREKLEVRIKYEGYVRRQDRAVAAAVSLEARELPAGLDYGAIAGLSTEAAQKLEARRPRNLAQASRIDGVRASDLSLLMVQLRRAELEASKPSGTDIPHRSSTSSKPAKPLKTSKPVAGASEIRGERRP